MTHEEIDSLANGLNLHFYETSAHTGQNVKTAFEWVARNILEKIFKGEIDPTNKVDSNK